MRQRGRDLFTRHKKLLLFLVRIISLFPKKIRCGCLNSIRYRKGKLAMACRYILLKSIAKKCGDNVSIHECVFFRYPENISFGDNVSVWPLCFLDAGGGITLGDNVSVAHGGSLISSNHSFELLDIPIKEQPMKDSPILIEDDVWIGAKVSVLAGTIIEKGCVIGANAVVLGKVKKNSVAVGVPAVAKRCRGNPPEELGKDLEMIAGQSGGGV